jgi:uncharacterized protein DUF5666
MRRSIIVVVASLAVACGTPQTAGPASATTARSVGASGATRVQGVVQAVTGDRVTLADGTTFDLTRTTRITRVQRGTVADLKPGLFVAITAKPQSDNTLLASIVSVFPESVRTAAQPGQRPLGEGNLMTNATIEEVNGNTFTVSFGTGTAKVVVAPDAQIIRQTDVQASDIVVGDKVAANVSNGIAQSVQIQQ